MSVAKQHLMFSERRGPLEVNPSKEKTDLRELLASDPMRIETWLLEHGALLFRGFECKGKQDFESIVKSLPYKKLDYQYRSTPRTALGGDVFTATEYPAAQQIPLHNENAYQRRWPLKLALFCERPAQSGGETPIADMRSVTARVGRDLVDEFAARGVQYIRHYHDFIDLPWQVVFQCQSRDEVARICAESGIHHEWIEGKLLRTTQVCQGVAQHPVSRERVFFNQAHLFHSSSLGAERERSMRNVFGPDRLPRHARFGDGAEISAAHLETVRKAFQDHAVAFPWRAGDVLLLDNMQFAHGRSSYKGERRVLAALLDPSL